VSDFELALAHYRMQFPTIQSLGDPPHYTAWRAEYDRVSASGLSATLVTASGSDGTNVSAQRNFSQTVLLSALLGRRAELDSDFASTVLAPVRPRRNLGITVQL
jgi:hypothetical protein